MAGTPSSSRFTQSAADLLYLLNTLADAKGDVIGASAADTWARVAVGANDTVLTADSAQTAGVKWATAGALSAVWTNYTPALTAATTDPTLGTGSSISGRYCTVGKQVLVYAQITFGTSGVAAGSGEYRVSMPANFGASFPSFTRCGIAFLYDSSAALGRLAVVQRESTNHTVISWVDSAGGSTTNAVPWTWAASDQYHLFWAYESV